MKVLFFTRKNDELSSKCIEHLVELGFEVDTILSSERGEKLPDDLGWIIHDYLIF